MTESIEVNQVNSICLPEPESGTSFQLNKKTSTAINND